METRVQFKQVSRSFVESAELCGSSEKLCTAYETHGHQARATAISCAKCLDEQRGLKGVFARVEGLIAIEFLISLATFGDHLKSCVCSPWLLCSRRCRLPRWRRRQGLFHPPQGGTGFYPLERECLKTFGTICYVPQFLRQLDS